MNGKPQIAFDRDGWVKVGRMAVATSAALWLTMAAVLLLVPSPNQCPGWHLKDSESLWWPLLGLGAPLNGIGCFIAVRLNWFMRRVIESDSDLPAIPATHFFVRFCVLNSVTAQFPLFLLLTKVPLRWAAAKRPPPPDDVSTKSSPPADG
jgi:hypothetical protein